MHQKNGTFFTPRISLSPRGEFISRYVGSYCLIGNRGVIHDDLGNLVHPFASQAWLACSPSHKSSDLQRPLAQPRPYTVLSFLDEPTSLAAGHRPCCTCRRADFYRFRAAWLRGNTCHRLTADTRISEVDAVLHNQRLGMQSNKVTVSMALDNLPDGCMVQLDNDDYLVRGQHLFRWSTSGYTEQVARPAGVSVQVLTPRSIVAALRAGYRPRMHHSVMWPNVASVQ